MLKPLAL